MSLTLSPAVKVFAVVGVLAALALVGGMMFLGRPPAETDAAPILLPTKKTTGPLAAIGKAQQVAATANAAVGKPAKVAATAEPTPAAAAAKPKAVARPKPMAVAKPKPKPKPKVAAKPKLVAANGLPTRIMRALRDRPVVIVALWSTGGKIDVLARDEAAKGAASAGAGFVAMDLLGNAREAEALTLKLGVILRAPGILIFTRPGMVSFTLGGFQDHETVAQAAANVLR